MNDHEQHFVGKVAHKAILERNGKVLLAKRTSDPLFDIPGGRIHSGEKPAEALKREIKEEIGVDIEVGKPFFSDLIISTITKEERYFVCFYASFSDESQPFHFDPTEVNEIYWVGKDEVETVPTYEVCRDALRVYFSERNG